MGNYLYEMLLKVKMAEVRVLELADYIVPGHANIYKVNK